MSNSDPSSPVQTKGLRSFSVSAPYPSNHEVDNARLILESKLQSLQHNFFIIQRTLVKNR